MEYALGIALALAVLAVVYLISRGADDRSAREQAGALLEQEKARRENLEEAAKAERDARAKELDAALSTATADDAARLLREQLSRRH